MSSLSPAGDGTRLDARPRLQLAEAAHQCPAAGGDVGHFGDGLHPLRTGDAHLQEGSRQLVTAHRRADGVERQQAAS